MSVSGHKQSRHVSLQHRVDDTFHGVLPAWWRPFVHQLPWYRRGLKDVQSQAGIAIMAVARRLATPTDRVDLLRKLKAGVGSDGTPIGREELTAEAQWMQ